MRTTISVITLRTAPIGNVVGILKPSRYPVLDNCMVLPCKGCSAIVSPEIFFVDGRTNNEEKKEKNDDIKYHPPTLLMAVMIVLLSEKEEKSIYNSYYSHYSYIVQIEAKSYCPR